jgi:hypothetical protein
MTADRMADRVDPVASRDQGSGDREVPDLVGVPVEECRWMAWAACRAFPQLPWTVDGSEVHHLHKHAMSAVCAACPVRRACHGYATSQGVTGGFWAGRFYNPSHWDIAVAGATDPGGSATPVETEESEQGYEAEQPGESEQPSESEHPRETEEGWEGEDDEHDAGVGVLAGRRGWRGER